jgi:putative CRISPR-associated protein (TIGR02619 family)
MEENMWRVFVSTVGTSLLISAVARVCSSQRPKIDHLLRETANLQENELDNRQKEAIKDLKSKAEAILQKASVSEARRYSAELNGIFGYYGSAWQDKSNKQDVHFLVSTDTFQGQITSEVVKQYLWDLGWQNVQIFTPRGLSTRDSRSFSSGVKEVIKWCKNEVSGYKKEDGYRTIFQSCRRL